jgi:hypothetical protein
MGAGSYSGAASMAAYSSIGKGGGSATGGPSPDDELCKLICIIILLFIIGFFFGPLVYKTIVYGA